MYTFDPHPVRVLAPRYCPALLQTTEQRIQSIEALGVDECVIEPFTLSLAEMSAERFFDEILLGRLNARAIFTGYDFTFGRHRLGTTDALMKLGKKYSVAIEMLEAQFAGETLISSTNIRSLIFLGDVSQAASLLGRNYSILGTVVTGRSIGGRLFVRTANISTKNEVVPRDGVYVSRTRLISPTALGDGSNNTYPSITSIGTNPTFPGSGYAIETHIIDFEGDIVGRPVELMFIDRLRDQEAFDSAEALTKQIRADIDEARRIHKIPERRQ